jgi:hypothetical protein
VQPRTPRYALAVLALVVVAVLGTGLVEAKTYWFEKYLRAVELIDKGQPGQAVELLEELILRDPVPSAAIRIPGNQYIDYLPYYQTARAQAALGDLDTAGLFLKRSHNCGALAQSRRRHTKELNKLQQSLGALGPTFFVAANP